MAEIDIERKEGHRWWPWLLTVLVLVVLGGAAWFLMGPGVGTEPESDLDTGTPGEFTPPRGIDGPPAAPPGTNPPDTVPEIIVP